MAKKHFFKVAAEKLGRFEFECLFINNYVRAELLLNYWKPHFVRNGPFPLPISTSQLCDAIKLCDADADSAVSNASLQLAFNVTRFGEIHHNVKKL